MGTIASSEVGGLPAEHREISAALTRARRNFRALPGFPGSVPERLEEAYAIQSRSIEAWPDAVVGWKVGGVPADYRDRFEDEWLAGPIFQANLARVGADRLVEMPVFAGGFAAIEAEFVLETGQDASAYRLYAGVEIAGSPVPDINGYGPCAVISDFGNNRGLLVGPEAADWQELGDVEVVTRIDGDEKGRTLVGNVGEGVKRSLDFLTRNLSARGISMPPGTLVSCGALTGVHEACVGAVGEIEFAGLGTLRLQLVEASASHD